MGVSKILIDNVGINLSVDTVAANKMLSGTTAHNSNGDIVTGNIPIKAATVYTPSTSNQTIAAGQYLGGAQTIKGDANLIATNIASGKTIFGVAGVAQPAKPEQSKTVTPTATGLIVTPDSGKVLSSVTVNGDANLIAANIKSGVNIFGVTGNMQGAKEEQTKTLTLGQNAPTSITPDSGKVLNAVSVSVNYDVIKPENITKNVKMLGVMGAHEGSGAKMLSAIEYQKSDIVAYTGNEGGVLDCAFKECTSLDNVTLPNASYIAPCAFLSCTNLYSISIPKATFIGERAFASCKRLPSIQLPLVNYVDTLAFGFCNISTITAPKLERIGPEAFEMCSNLKTINFPSVKYIEQKAFYDCDSLTTANISRVEYIGDEAFRDCGSLTTVNITSVKTIGTGAFRGCNLLKSVSIPNVESIGSLAFTYCSSLASISLPSSIKVIGPQTFLQCQSMSFADIQNVERIESSAFYGCFSLTLAGGLSALQSVTYIGVDAFRYCSTLNVRQINASIIYPYAFCACSALEAIEINNLTTISANAFRECKSLRAVQASKVRVIEQFAFANCTQLGLLELPSTVYVTLSSSSAFINTLIASGKGQILVPSSMVAGYKTRNHWSYFSSMIISLG